jgi:Peptidase S24-like
VARKKTPKYRLNLKADLSNRLKEIRQDLFGDHGGPELARRLNLPARTWYNYETGVTVPAEVLLAFIDQTGANPMWLLTGEGQKFRRGVEDQVLGFLSPEELIRKGLDKLEQRAHEVVITTAQDLPNDGSADFVAVALVPLESLAETIPPNGEGTEYVMAFRQWLPRPRETFAARLSDDAMHPILPVGSIIAIDRTTREPQTLEGRIVVALAEGQVVVRWLEMSGRHLILRPNHAGTSHSTVALEYVPGDNSPVLGQVVWSWSKFGKA